MQAVNQTTNYDKIAHIYNEHFGKTSSKFLLPVMNDLLIDKLPNGASILDLCCGTGETAAILSKDGFHITGLDISKNMIKYAKNNAPNCDFHVCDVRNIKLTQKFQGIYSLFNGINHILTIEDLGRLFKSVHSLLEDNGLFFFDIDDELGFKNKWKGSVQLRDSNHCYISNMIYDQTAKLGKSHVTLLNKASDEWLRSDVDIVTKHFSVDNITSSLKKARFRKVHIFDAKTDFGIDVEAGRKFFLCAK